jgi:hypothetical protein
VVLEANQNSCFFGMIKKIDEMGIKKSQNVLSNDKINK